MAETLRQTFKLCDQQTLSNCYSFIAENYQLQDEKRKLMATVELMDSNKARSLAQNSLYWQWVGLLSGEIGDTRDELHTRLKWQFLRPIYLRDDREFAEMMLSVDEYKKHATKTEFAAMAKGVSSLMSTTKATVKQMSEYLDSIDKYYYAKGLALPKPDDYTWIRGQ